MKNQYLLQIWLKWLNLFWKITILSLTQMWNMKYLDQLLARNSLHHMRVYIWTTCRIRFSKNEQIQPWISFRYIDDIFFIWTSSEKELEDFLERKFIYERSSKTKSISLMLLLELIMVNLSPISPAKLPMAIITFTLNHVTLVTQNL